MKIENISSDYAEETSAWLGKITKREKFEFTNEVRA